MHTRILAPLAVAAGLLLLPGLALADYPHVVAPGETLTSVAAADGLSVSALAAANGLSPSAELVSGTVLDIPPQTAYTEAGSPEVSAAPADVSSAAAPASSAGGSYVVQPGDTLTAISERAGTTVAELAALNGLNPDGILLAGSTLELSGGGTENASVTASDSTTGGTAPVESSQEIANTAGDPPYPTDEDVSSGEIANIADANGVPAPLAQAIGWQESGWNNDEVSDDGAVGVMQVLPGTWSWINSNLTPSDPLEPASASENVRGGVLLLHALLSATGSDSEAAAGYYQGLSSVQKYGMYPSTQQYVNNVMSLEQRFASGQ